MCIRDRYSSLRTTIHNQIAYIISRFKEMSIIYNYIFFKYSSNSDNFIFLVKLEIYTSFE